MKPRPPQLDDRDWLEHEYAKKRRTTSDISRELGCARSTVSAALQRFAIPVRLGGPAPIIVKPGDRYGRLTLETKIKPAKGRSYWRCRCDCGGAKEVTAVALRRGHVRSCGCLVRETAARTGRTGKQRQRGVAEARVRQAAQRLKCFTVAELAVEAGLGKRATSRYLKRLEERGTVRPPVYEWSFEKPASTPPARDSERAPKPKNYSGAGPSGGVDLPADKDMRRLAQQAIGAGAKVRRSGSDHFRVTLPNGKTVTISNTPSSNRAVTNARADLQRAGLAV